MPQVLDCLLGLLADTDIGWEAGDALAELEEKAASPTVLTRLLQYTKVRDTDGPQLGSPDPWSDAVGGT